MSLEVWLTLLVVTLSLAWAMLSRPEGIKVKRRPWDWSIDDPVLRDERSDRNDDQSPEGQADDQG